MIGDQGGPQKTIRELFGILGARCFFNRRRMKLASNYPKRRWDLFLPDRRGRDLVVYIPLFSQTGAHSRREISQGQYYHQLSRIEVMKTDNIVQLSCLSPGALRPLDGFWIIGFTEHRTTSDGYQRVSMLLNAHLFASGHLIWQLSQLHRVPMFSILYAIRL